MELLLSSAPPAVLPVFLLRHDYLGDYPVGWKNIKEHFSIRKFVYVKGDDVWIGTLANDLVGVLRISPHGSVSIDQPAWCNQDLQRVYDDLSSHGDKVKELLQRPDHFRSSIKVYTFNGSNISEAYCEKPGWPNNTHDGRIMFVGRYSQDRDQVIAWAIENAQYRIEKAEQELEALLSYDLLTKGELVLLKQSYAECLKVAKDDLSALHIEASKLPKNSRR